MNLIENIKEFFKLKGLDWTGDILTQTGNNFRPSTEQDFESLRNLDYLIDFARVILHILNRIFPSAAQPHLFLPPADPIS